MSSFIDSNDDVFPVLSHTHFAQCLSAWTITTSTSFLSVNNDFLESLFLIKSFGYITDRLTNYYFFAYAILSWEYHN